LNIFEEREAILDIVDGSREVLGAIHDVLAEDGLTVKAYAKVFSFLHYVYAADEDKISYSSRNKTWMKGDEAISDIRLFGVLGQACDVIYQYVEHSWRSSVFSSWMSQKELEKALAQMKNQESITEASKIIKIAMTLMPVSNEDSDGFGWEGTPITD
jgi:hypothetical protein